MIELDQVSFEYTEGQETLRDFCLSIPAGECILLCGESGCGKTTVTKLINGLIPHFTENGSLKGRVTANGMVVADTELYQLAKEIGSVFQNPKSQFFNLDTDSELAFGLENEGDDPAYMECRLAKTVKELHLERLLHRNIFSLSGGEKQMLAFASVYAMNPAVFVLDEPTANLDGEAIERLRGQIRLLKAQGHTVVVAEHRLYFLADIVDRAIYLKDGRLLYSLTGEELCRLSEERRIELGLRALAPGILSLPSAAAGNEEEGLVVEKLTCAYKKQPAVIEKLSFAARCGEVLAVTGPNGVGKTTLIRCLCGLMKETEGRVLLDGKPLKQKARQRESFLVMQDVNHQLFYDSVQAECEQVAQGGKEKLEDVLARFDLLALRMQHPMALSGGQKQRLAVAAAMLSGKRLLIFDEPTSGLDYRNMKAVSRVVRELAEQGHIVLVVSHDIEFMQEACDRVLELKERE